MKRPQPDFGAKLRKEFIQKQGFVRRFVNYWGTTTVDGVEVMNYQHYYYKTSRITENGEKLFKHLGIYEDLTTGSMKGIDRAWLYLNPVKEGVPDYDKNILAANIEELLKTEIVNEQTIEGLELEILIGPRVETTTSVYSRTPAIKSVTNLDIVSRVGTDSQASLINEVNNNYTSWWNSNNIVHFAGSASGYTSTGAVIDLGIADIYAELLAKYVLQSTDIESNITSVSKGFMNLPTKPRTSYDSDGQMITSYGNVTYKAVSVKVRIPTQVVKATDDLIVRIANQIGTNTTVFKDGLTNIAIVQKSAGIKTVTEVDDSDYSSDQLSYVTKVYTSFPFNDLNNFWYGEIPSYSLGAVTRYYLKAEVLKGDLLTLDEKITLINSMLDSGYKKKSTKWYKKLISIGLFVVAVWLAVPTGGASLAAMTAIQIATVVALAGFYYSLMTMAVMYLGDEGLAMAMARLNEAIAPLVLIASVVTVYTAWAQNAAKAAAMEAGKEGLKAGATATFSETVEYAIKEFAKSITSPSFSQISFQRTLQAANFIFDAYKDSELGKQQEKIKRNEAKLAEYEQFDEQSNVKDMAKELAKVSMLPLDRDFSFYEGMTDLPYEPWATAMHSGCSQGNGVKAWWTTDRNYLFPEMNIYNMV